MAKKLILVKLGGSLITDKTKPYTARLKVMSRLGQEIKSFFDQKEVELVVAQGVGSFAHTSAAKYETKKGFCDQRGRLGACITHHDAATINRLLVGQLLKVGLPVASVAPSSVFLASNGSVWHCFYQSVEVLLDKSIIPVLYGDVIWDRKKGCTIFSGEESLNLLVKYFLKQERKVKRVIFCGTENGVWGQSREKRLEVITADTFPEIKKYLGGSHGVDVTGGMLHKVEQALKLAQEGIETWIINGRRKSELVKALAGKKISGTIVR
ncbi:isopentenyl phosphate kinase [Patescibacteria group bacterium]|nr:isopentenyl phosphate kinase [Patescibacteria group bacterium]